MSPSREERIFDLIQRALARPPEERLAFLEEACGEDPALLDQIQKALDQTDESWGGQLDQATALGPRGAAGEDTEHFAPGTPGQGAPAGAAGDPNPSLSAIRHIGPYRILEPLGQGGMGQVFLAEQREPVERLVALKLIHDSLVGTSARARFDAERSALARLSHPNIGQIYDAGTTSDGFPYFVMERIEGAPITEYCDAANLSIEERLELMLAVCRGVEHAHRKQLLHRDLKPSNILVTEIDGVPTPKIIDFGIAKSLGDSLVESTQMTQGQVIGTPAYLSPETLEGRSADIDTRTDVYSLGIVLYELLAGRRPYEAGEGFASLLRRILHEPAPRPSTRVSSLDDDTRTTVAARRGAQPAELRRRLQDDLDWVVLKAIAREREERYGSAAELAADLERHLRHEPVSAGPPTAAYRLRKWLRRNWAAALAGFLLLASLTGGLVARSMEAERANQAAAAAREAQQAAETARDETEQVAAFLIRLFRGASPEQTRGEEISALELLERGTEEVSAGFDGPRRVQAMLLERIGGVHYSLGQADRALQLADQALEIRQSEVEEDPAAYGNLLRSMGIYTAAATGDLREAQTFYERALRVLEEALGPDHWRVGAAHNSLATNAAQLRDLEPAIFHYQRALEIMERDDGPGRSRLIGVLTNFGATLAMVGRHDEAAPHLARAVEVAERIHGPEALDTASSLVNLSFSLTAQGLYEESEGHLQRAIAIRQKVLPPAHPEIAHALLNFGAIRERQERMREAAGYFRQALEIYQTSLGPDHRITARGLQAVGSASWKMGKADEAEPYLRRALAIRGAELPRGHPELADSVATLAALLEGTGRGPEAADLKEAWLPPTPDEGD